MVAECLMNGSTLCLALLLAVGPASAATIIVGPAEETKSLAAALRLAKDGDTIGVLSGEYRGDVAVVEHRKLTIQGIGKRPVFIADGKDAEGKAILVVRDGDIRIENIEFRGARVPDGNGAGIRFEKGHLMVRRCAFFDNQNGLLTANFANAQLSIEDSEFAQAPRDEGKLHHLLYVGRIASLTVTGSHFHQGHIGHLIKSRARSTTLAYNLIYDGVGGRASYEVDLPNGGDALLIGNVIGQSADTENPVVVAFGAEGQAWPNSRLLLVHNTLISDGVRPAWFLRVWDERLPVPLQVHALNNLSVGLGAFTLAAPGVFKVNFPSPSAMLVDTDSLAFALKAHSPLRGLGVDPGTVDGRDLRPKAEFALPVGTRPLPGLTQFSPGAFQH
jgi:hypothetical protein